MNLEVVDRPEDARHWVEAYQRKNEVVGVVPTMGALHRGHFSLIERACNECDRVVVSIFVNPTQFAPGEDFAKYPRPLEEDLRAYRRYGVGMVFHPAPEAMYATDYCTWVEVDGLAEGLEGEYRPGHFRGVATVVLKLFHALPANFAYFGQKDAQQLAIIRRMVQDLDMGIEVVACPTVREEDGLALSSRNRYLAPEERAAAPALFQALRAGRAAFHDGIRTAEGVTRAAKNNLAEAPLFRVQYIECVDPERFVVPSGTLSGRELIVAAAHLGTTRLIDNLSLEEGTV